MLIIRILFTHTVVIVIPLNFRASIVWMTITYKNIILMKQQKSPIYLRLEKLTSLRTSAVHLRPFYISDEFANPAP